MILQALSRKDNENYVFMSCAVDNLQCGTPYRFFISCRNSLGDSPDSAFTYTIITAPGEPQKPESLQLMKATLSSLQLKWDPPFDGGSAIVGYTLKCEHFENEITLKRSQTSYDIRLLQPNITYVARIAALNAFGASEFSDPLSMTTSCAPPDRPSPLRAVAGTWRTMDLEGTLPYSFNAMITMITLERRWLRPFTKGPWESAIDFKVPEDISILTKELMRDEDDVSIASSMVSSLDGEMNRFFRISTRIRGQATDELSHIEVTIPRLHKHLMFLILSQKKHGDRFRIEVMHLKPNTVYEFRFSCTNFVGTSRFSYPSRRAKTNKIRPPQAFSPPFVVSVQNQSAKLRINLPPLGKGASPILRLHVDTKDTIKKISNYFRSVFSVSLDGYYNVGSLRPGGSYQFRVLGESIQGKGAVSQWSDIAVVPTKTK